MSDQKKIHIPTVFEYFNELCVKNKALFEPVQLFMNYVLYALGYVKFSDADNKEAVQRAQDVFLQTFSIDTLLTTCLHSQ